MFYNDRGIKRCISAPSTPLQNRISERRNRSIMDYSRTLMMEKKVSLKKLDNIICKQCQLGEMKKSSFKNKTHTSKGILKKIHTNLCGPIDVKRYKGGICIMLFFVYYSRMIIVMFLNRNLIHCKCLSDTEKKLRRK